MFKRNSPKPGTSGLSKILDFSPFSRKDAKERVTRAFEAVQDPFGLMATRASLFPGEVSDGTDSETVQDHNYIHEDASESKTADSTEPVPSPADVLASMEQGFFTEGFDGLRFILEKLPPDGVTNDVLREEEESMLSDLEVVSSGVNARVMENYSDFLGGMALVSQLQSDLSVSSVVVKSGRRFLNRAHEDVQASLGIAALNRKKGRLLEVLETFKLLQVADSVEITIRSKLNEHDFIGAICEYVEGCTMLSQVEGLACEPALRARLNEALKALSEQMESTIQCLCERFDSVQYQKVFEAYHLLLDICPGDELKSMDLKLQECFVTALERECDGVLVGYTLTMDSSEALASKACAVARVQYKELCRHLPAQNFHSCLCTTLQILFDLLCSHYNLMAWHQKRAKDLSSEDQPIIQTGSGDSVAGSSSLSGDTEPNPPPNEELGSSNPAVQNATTEGEISERERAVCKAVANTLRCGARTMWEMAAMRVGALLNAPSAPDGSHFMQILQLAQKFILVGEAFTRTEAVSLRGHVAKTSATFFAAKQHRHLEVLRMMLEKEMWQRVPIDSVPQISQDLRRSSQGHSSAASPSVSPATSSTFKQYSPNSKDGDAEGSKQVSEEDGKDPFEKWAHGRNPFHHSAAGDDEDDAAEEAEKEGGTRKAGASDEEDEDEDEELHGDFIDEESQTVSTRARTPSQSHRSKSGGLGGRQTSRGRNQGQGLASNCATLTASSVHLLRCLAEYLWLTRCLGSGASMIFAAICQLFEAYFLAIFQTFGKKEALASDSYDLTPRLQQTLRRLSERSQFTSASSPISPSPSSGMPSAGPSNGSQSSGAPGSVISSGNLYGLKERCVAAQSLHTVAEEALKARPVLEIYLGPGSLKDIDQFYSRTVDAVEDLREHIYKAAARLLLNLQWLPDEIGDSEKIDFQIGSSKKYDRKEVGMQHNPWVDKLLAQFTQFSAKVMCADMPRETNSLLWEYGAEATCEAMLEGLSRVRKCTEMGRACMALDLQVIVQSLKKHMTIYEKEPNVMIVDNYIKAFYVQENQLVHWAMTHPEYTRSQIIALVNQIATAYNWKRSQRSDMLSKLEECFM